MNIQTLGVLQGDEFDRAMVEVYWQGTRYLIDADGSARETTENTLRRHLLVLGRKHGVQTQIGASISSAHCPGCGAPTSNSAGNACDFCGAVLNDTGKSWVLTAMLDAGSDEARDLLRQARGMPSENGGQRENGEFEDVPAAYTPASSAAQLAWMVKLVTSDGVVDESERELLTAVAGRRNVPMDRVQQMIDASLRGDLQPPEPSSLQQGREWLAGMAAAALVDGIIQAQEMKLLKTAGVKLGLSDRDLDLLIKREKTRLFQQAQSGLKEMKGRGTR